MYLDALKAAEKLFGRGVLRPAKTAQERFAADALVSLTAVCDGALKDDEMGFSAADTGLGRMLGAYVGRGAEFDDAEWRGICALVRKYHGQVGRMPSPDDEDRRLDAQYQEALDSLRERSKHAHKVEKRLAVSDFDVVLIRDGDEWIVEAPYVAAATVDWRTLPGRRWDGARGVNRCPYRESRALDALLRKHYAGKLANGPKGAFMVGFDK
jgi:hypothetical protein